MTLDLEQAKKRVEADISKSIDNWTWADEKGIALPADYIERRQLLTLARDLIAEVERVIGLNLILIEADKIGQREKAELERQLKCSKEIQTAEKKILIAEIEKRAELEARHAALLQQNVQQEQEIEELESELCKMREALGNILTVCRDREAFVAQGPRGFARAEQIAEQALASTSGTGKV